MNALPEKDEREGIPSASKLGALALCPGRHNAEKFLPSTSSAAALNGEIIHEVAAILVAGGALPSRANAVQIEEAGKLVDAFYKIRSEVFPHAEHEVPDIIEERFWLKDLDGNKIMSGQLDIGVLRSHQALISDYKTGWSAVDPAAENLQMRGYAVLLKEAYPEITSVCVAIIQPNTGAPTLARYDNEDLMRARLEIMSILRLANDENAPRVAGAKQCQYCAAKATCAEYNAAFVAPVPAITGYQLTAKDWSQEQRAKFCEMLPEITAWIDDRKAELKLLAANGEVPGWKVGSGKETSKVKDAGLAYQAVADVLDAAQFTAACSISLPKLRKVYAKASGLTEKAAKEILNGRLEDLIETTTSEGSLEQIK